MPYYEIITESGTNMVGCYDSDDEMMSAVKAHHERAKKGQVGGPSGHAAERIVRVEKYDNHPGEVTAGMSADVAKKELATLVDEYSEGGVVDVEALALAARRLNSPLVAERTDRQSSMYVADAVETFTEGWDS